MPRRLAPLLILLYTVATYARTPVPDNTHVPVKAVAVPHPDVFIPLKEWKRQRIQDIESRVRRAEEKRTYLRRRSSAVCKRRSRLLEFLLRINVCPPSPSPSLSPSPPSPPPLLPTTAPKASLGDPQYVSGKHANGDVNHSAELNGTSPLEDIQSTGEPAVSPVVVEHGAHFSEQPSVASIEAIAATPQENHPPGSTEPDELTGRIEGYIPKVLPQVLPNVIPKVSEIVKSIKEASLAYKSTGDVPLDSLNPTEKAVERNKTGNCTVQQTKGKVSRDEDRTTAQKEEPNSSRKSDKETTSNLFEDEQMLNVIVKHCKDSGVKEKPYNYASIDAGARVLAFSNGSVGAKNVIQGNDDKYLLSPCASSGIAGSRFVDLELSEEVILESIETGNFEYYSSSPRKVAVLGATSYPPPKWNVLGIFDFANVKKLQKFQIEKRKVTRYLRVIFAGKQGTEYYCPISTVRAFGKNLLADWKELLEKPVAPRKPATEQGVVSKGKTDKESDEHKNGNTENMKKVDKESSEIEAACSFGDSCKDEKETPTVSESPTVAPKGTLERDNQSTMPKKVFSSRRDEMEGEGTEANGRNEKDGKERVDEDDDEASEADVNAESMDNGDNQNPSAQITGGAENRNMDEANYGDSDHVSEDDQVVIDALHADTLSPVEGDDNIFRKVTRMLRLLELNQTLTNQYIDTQLAKFAVALSDSRSTSRNASERIDEMQRQLEILIIRLENQIEELIRASFRRDVLLCILLVCVAFLLGTHWILWSAVGSARLHDESGLRRPLFDSEVERIDRMLQTDESSRTSVTRVEGISSEGPSPAGRKKKRKGKRPFAGENTNGGYFSGNKMPPANGFGAGIEERSVSSFEMSLNERRRLSGTGGTFDVLGRIADP